MDYNTEMVRLRRCDFKDSEGNLFEINIKEIPDYIKWYGKYICYSYSSKKGNKVFFMTLNAEKGTIVPKMQSQDIPVKYIEYIQSSWIVITDGFGLFFSNEGETLGKSMLNMNMNEEFIGMEIYNDVYIVILYKGCISVYDYNDGSCVQELTTDTTNVPVSKFLSKGIKNIYIVIITQQNEKDKKENYVSLLWEVRELSFNKQIDLLLKHNQLDKALGILNNKLDYNMDKFTHLEKFYCDCAWNCFKQRDKKGYEEAEKYFRLCNFNPFELIYHYIDNKK